MAVLIGSLEDNRYLVVYGGASPEFGPLGDTVYAVLPKPEDIGNCYAIVDTYVCILGTIISCTMSYQLQLLM